MNYGAPSRISSGRHKFRFFFFTTRTNAINAHRAPIIKPFSGEEALAPGDAGGWNFLRTIKLPRREEVRSVSNFSDEIVFAASGSGDRGILESTGLAGKSDARRGEAKRGETRRGVEEEKKGERVPVKARMLFSSRRRRITRVTRGGRFTGWQAELAHERWNVDTIWPRISSPNHPLVASRVVAFDVSRCSPRPFYTRIATPSRPRENFVTDCSGTTRGIGMKIPASVDVQKARPKQLALREK